MYKSKEYDNFGDKLYGYYNSCHIYTHGNILVSKYPIFNILFIVETIGTILLDIAEDMDQKYKIEKLNGIDLIEHTMRHYLETLDKFENINDEMVKEYYKSKRNLKIER